MIVKHRRGTTREWQEVNLDFLPEAGELVIEECDDGARKCKIGTGYTRFSELPYIDDKTRADLLAEIAEVKKYFKNKFADLNEDFLAELATLETELKSVEAKCYENTIDYISRDADLRAILEKNIEDAVKALEGKVDLADKNSSDTRTSLLKETARIEERLVSTEKVFEANLKEASDELRAELVDLADDYIDRDAEVQATLSRNLASAVSTLKTDYNTKYTNVNTDIAELDEIVRSNTAKIDAATRRISTLVVPEGSTLTRDAEVIDIRVGYDGTEHTSAGDAVRAVGNDLLVLDSNVKRLEEGLSQYIGSQAVSGLHYDINGEVGLCQPYML